MDNIYSFRGSIKEFYIQSGTRRNSIGKIINNGYNVAKVSGKQIYSAGEQIFKIEILSR
jgi:hypothetical protein